MTEPAPASLFVPFAQMPVARLRAVRLLAADVDDTITDEGKIPISTLQAFADLEQAGVRVALVTGRSAGWAQALATYLPSLHLVVGENGLVMFDARGKRRDLGPAPQYGESRRKLTENSERIRTAHGLVYTDDDPFRLFERTFDRPPGFDAAALAACARLVDPDVEVIGSSIHLHVRPRGWGKSDGLVAALVALAAPRPRVEDDHILFIGDSANDRPMFARFPQGSVGVRNLLAYAKELGDDRPRYLTQGVAAAGLREVTQAIVSSRS